MNNIKELLLKRIDEMLQGFNIDEIVGICYNLHTRCGQLICCFNLVEDLSMDWEHFSGSMTFPVSGHSMYTSHIIEGTLWVGEQLVLRHSLLEHLKKKILEMSEGDFEKYEYDI